MHPTSQIGAPLNHDPVPTLQWVECASFFQIPGFQIVGLASPEVTEARERIRAAMEACGFEFPRRRVIVNLSPASVRKRGTGSDLSMALAVLQSNEENSPLAARRIAAWGELGLDGRIKAAGRITRAVYAAWKHGADRLVVSGDEALGARQALREIQEGGALAGAAPLLCVARDLREAWELLRAGTISAIAEKVEDEREFNSTPENSRLQPPAELERPLLISAVGAHHILLLGPRGAGKSQALDWRIHLEPDLDPEIRLARRLLDELRHPHGEEGEHESRIRRVSGLTRPTALTGGYSPTSGLRPGEFALAHGGLLLADELPEWSRDSREALREPLETGRVTITCARESAQLPAQFTLIATGNICPCGGVSPRFTSIKAPESSRCRCQPGVRSTYLSRLSGPLLDRMDLVLYVQGRPADASGSPGLAEKVSAHRELAYRLRGELRRRYGMPPGRLSGAELEDLLRDEPEWKAALDARAYSSLRSRHKILRVALTLRELPRETSDKAQRFDHFVAEALLYRPESLGLWET